MLSNLPISLPPAEEQTEIIRRVESLFAFADRLEARYKASRARVERLTPALLAKAFRGELVPQDPNDEPASVLLERIRTARAVAQENGTKAHTGTTNVGRKKRSVSGDRACQERLVTEAKTRRERPAALSRPTRFRPTVNVGRKKRSVSGDCAVPTVSRCLETSAPAKSGLRPVYWALPFLVPISLASARSQ
jgi:hypothetical protein